MLKISRSDLLYLLLDYHNWKNVRNSIQPLRNDICLCSTYEFKLHLSAAPFFSSFVKAPTPNPIYNRDWDWGSFKWKPSMHSNAVYQVSHSALGSDSRQSLAGSQSLCRSHGPCLRVSWAVGWEEFIFLNLKCSLLIGFQVLSTMFFNFIVFF